MIIDQEPSYKKIAILVSVVALAAIAILAFLYIDNARQIKNLSAKLEGAGAGAIVPPNKKTTNQAAGQPKQNTLTEVMKDFSGKVVNVSSSGLTIETQLVDFSKPKNSDKFKNSSGEPLSLSDKDFETMTKIIEAGISDKTIFDKKPLVDLKVGDMVFVTSDKSPYTTDTVTAEKVTYTGTPK
jgi:hypothetical protein